MDKQRTCFPFLLELLFKVECESRWESIRVQVQFQELQKLSKIPCKCISTLYQVQPSMFITNDNNNIQVPVINFFNI